MPEQGKMKRFPSWDYLLSLLHTVEVNSPLSNG